MKRFFILTAFLMTFTGCQSVYSNVTDISPEAHGRESLKAIEFSIRDTSATKGPSPVTSLSQFNVSATTGSTGSEASKLSNVVFEKKDSVFRSDAVWPSSDPGYHFYASNVAMTHNASGQSVTISSIDKDVVCAYLASPSYKVKNDLTFNHILARVGTVSFTNLDLCSNVRLSMKYSGSGTYNIGTGKWSGVGSQSTKELTADNDFWIIPGEYQATLTYNDGNGNPQSKTLSQDFLAGKINNISAKLDGSVVVKTEDEYEAPTFTLGTISDVPAGGGDSGTPSVTSIGQRKRVKKTLADGSVKYDPDWTAVSSPDYTIQYGKTLASLSDNCPSYHGDNLGTTAKERTKLGDIYVRVKIGDLATDKNLTVYQAANARHKGQTAEKNHTRTGSVTYGNKSYYGDTRWGSKSYGSEYLKDTSYGSEVQDADTYGDWSTYNTSTVKYDYAVSFATTSWSPGAVETSKSNSVTAYHYEKDQYDQRRTITHHYHTPYTQHYYKDWTRKGSRDYTRSASQKCNYIECRTDTFDSGATEYVEESKSHTESWTDYGTDSNYDTDNGSDWTRDATGSTSRTSDGGYGYQTTYGSGTKKPDSPTPTSNATWLTYSNGTMSVTSNSSTSTRSAKLSVTNGTATASCSVTQGENSKTGTTPRYESESIASVTTDTDYWVKINGETSPSVPVSAAAGSVTVNVTAGHTHTVQPRKRTRTYEEYTWAVGPNTTGNYSSWTESDNGDPTVTYPSDTPTLSSDESWLKTDGSYTENTGSSSRSGKITAAVKVGYTTKASATLTVTQAAATITYKLTCTGTAVSEAVGETKTFSPTVKKQKYVNGNASGSASTVYSGITYTIGNSSIATVTSSTKKVTGVSAGSTKIYATATIDGVSYNSKDNGDSGISVTVTSNDEYDVDVD